MKKVFPFSSTFLSIGFAAVRIITGILMVYHGLEIFDADKIKGYSQWLTDLKFPAPLLMAYLGKGAEFVGGLLLVAGLFTRLAALTLAITMLVVCFVMGQGRIFTDDQHPFLFVLLAAVFFFTGAGKWSLDGLIFGHRNPFS
jgi:putative oxidoreductase